MTDIYADVTFGIHDDETSINELHAKARECDEENGVDAPERYTLVQALQVVWQHDFVWLHRNFLHGWTLDAAGLQPDDKHEIRWATT